MEYPVRVIAHIETDFEDKFGVPRQSSLVESLCAVSYTHLTLPTKLEV